MRFEKFLFVIVLNACSSSAEKTGGTPTIKHGDRKVNNNELVEVDRPRNSCSLNVKKHITQFTAIKTTCGELPDEINDFSGLSDVVLSIPKTCTLGHFYNQDEHCTVTTELTCETSDGCTEVRYLDFDWTPQSNLTGAAVNEQFIGDGQLELTRTCAASRCEGTYRAITFAITK